MKKLSALLMAVVIATMTIATPATAATKEQTTKTTTTTKEATKKTEIEKWAEENLAPIKAKYEFDKDTDVFGGLTLKQFREKAIKVNSAYDVWKDYGLPTASDFGGDEKALN